VSTTVVLPTYNERDNIVGILARIEEVLPECRVLVVDDSSPDGTAEVAEEVAKRWSSVEVVKRASKDGLGSAYRFAFSRLFGDERSDDNDVIITMDSDFSHDPAVIPAMLSAIESGADAVVGSRYVENGGTVNWPLHRRLLSRWGNRYTSWILDVPIRDCTSGFRAYRLKALQSIEPQSTSAEGYAFLTELAVRLTRAGFLVREVPILFTDRTAGTSKMSGRIILESMTLVTKWGLSRRLAKMRRQ
jgi:dolichol-phosphate mannosyltransferase